MNVEPLSGPGLAGDLRHPAQKKLLLWAANSHGETKRASNQRKRPSPCLRIITRGISQRGAQVPPWSSARNTDLSVSCDNYTMSFPE
jgi:hypothetical protein